MAETAYNSKRASRNALALAIRMIIATLVGLYTSRIVLEALGVDDYGIYSVVGGVIALASFVNKAMASATSRFITVEIGAGSNERLQRIFSSSFQIHLLICLVVILFGETIGLWFVNTKMVFPENRMFAVNVLYQLSIFSTVISFTQIPYNADIIAHEKMGIYAIIELLNSGLKLAIVVVLFAFSSDRLILYGFLTFTTNILIALIYRVYCIRNYDEARISFTIDRGVIKSMLSYSGFSFFSSLGSMANAQGKPIVLNLFFGVVANAASSIALTVVGAVEGLSTSISTAFNPQIIKTYSAGELENMQQTMRRGMQYTLWAFSAISVPVILEASSVLKLWLGILPPYSELFLQLIMIVAMVRVYSNTAYIALSATGNIRTYSIITGILYLLCPLIAYLILSVFRDAAIVYYTEIVICLIVGLISTVIIKNAIPELNVRNYYVSAVRSYVAIALILFCTYWIRNYFYPEFDDIYSISGFKSLEIIFTTTLVSLILEAIIYPLIALDKAEIRYVTSHIQKICRTNICRLITHR